MSSAVHHLPGSADPADAPGGVDLSGVDLPGAAALVADGAGCVPVGALAGLLAGLGVEGVADDGVLLEVAVAFQRVAAWAEAGSLAALAEFARRPEVVGPEPSAGASGRAPVGEVAREFAADEIAPRLGLSSRSADRRLGVAVALAGRLPQARRALASGRVDYSRAVALVDETVMLTAADAGRVESVVLARGGRATVGVWRDACRRAVVTADPSAAERRCRKARSERRVWAGPEGDGVGVVEAHLRVEDAAAVDAAVTAAARAWAQLPGEARTMDQLRADAFAAPFLKALQTGVLDGAEPVRLARRDGLLPAVHVHIHPDVLAQPVGGSAEVRGFGPVPGSLGRWLAARAQVRAYPDLPLAADPEPAYRPSRGLAERVQRRDRTCRFPGCRRRAETAELDHTVPYPHGPTAEGNLGALCKRHHLFKHTPGVRLDQPWPGFFRWQFPTGHHYEVDPPET